MRLVFVKLLKKKEKKRKETNHVLASLPNLLTSLCFLQNLVKNNQFR